MNQFSQQDDHNQTREMVGNAYKNWNKFKSTPKFIVNKVSELSKINKILMILLKLVILGDILIFTMLIIITKL